MLVIVGNYHVLKKLEWQDQVVNKHKSIREYLNEQVPNLKMVSIGQVIGDSGFEDDCRKWLSPLEGLVALDLDDRFKGWKSGITESMVVKDAEVYELLDGLIVY